MKKIIPILYIISIVICIGLCSCKDNPNENNEKDASVVIKSYSIIWNGNDITSKMPIIEYFCTQDNKKYVSLPLFAIWSRLGAEYHWTDANNCDIVFSDRSYVLNSQTGFIFDRDNYYELYGEKHYLGYQLFSTDQSIYPDYTKALKIYDGDVMIDCERNRSFFREVMNLSIEYNYNERVISFTENN
ncbi:MAG: hypothetical protein IJR90_08630 [Clostridia bacterium]|nr:hypothetical protein [Clostridia bacterium]